MIIMFLNGGVPPEGDHAFALIDHQAPLMQLAVAVAGITIPLMLLVDPLWKAYRAKAKVAQEESAGDQYGLADKSEDNAIIQLAKPLLAKDANHGLGELFIHSMIETIEYVLGTVSNTASYLRLWALSLAHGQLAKVFLDYTLGLGLKSGSYIMVSHSFLVL